MWSPLTIALWSALVAPPTDAEDLGIAPYGDTPPSLDLLSETEEQVDERRMNGEWFPGLVELENLTIGLKADGISAARNLYEGPASIVVNADLEHRYDSDVTDIQVKLIFIEPKDLSRTWRRISALPLDLSDAELDEKLPRPLFTVEQPLADQARAGVKFSVTTSEDFEDISVPVASLPVYIGMVSGYRLVNPTINDLRRIVASGNVTDFSALSAWLESGGSRSLSFTTTERHTLIEDLAARLRRLRAPPGPGDFRRMHGLLGLITEFARPEDLRTLLRLDRPMSILLMSAALSHEAAQTEENSLELPIHGLRSLPSGNRLIDAYKRALREIRRSALPKLLEFAYDPLDFPERSTAYKRSELHDAAKSVLDPLDIKKPAGMLHAARDNLDVQRGVLTFYTAIKSAAAIEPLIRWVIENPSEVDTIGASAVQAFGPSIIPSLLRFYMDPIARGERTIARQLLLLAPAEAAQVAIETLRSSGVMLSANVSMQMALEAYEARELQLIDRYAKDLENKFFGEAEEEATDSARIRAVTKLVEIAPRRVVAREDDTIRILADLAIRMRSESPAESRRAMDLLETLDFANPDKAKEALVLVRAKNAFSALEYREGLDVLLEFDPTLERPRLRA
ncbi:MAG: hypothetical protein ACPHRO_02740, partial [Nannocystaceae bacterium]